MKPAQFAGILMRYFRLFRCKLPQWQGAQCAWGSRNKAIKNQIYEGWLTKPVAFWKQCKQIKNTAECWESPKTWSSSVSLDQKTGRNPRSSCPLSNLTTAIRLKMRYDQECWLVKSQLCRFKCKQSIWRHELPSLILTYMLKIILYHLERYHSTIT